MFVGKELIFDLLTVVQNNRTVMRSMQIANKISYHLHKTTTTQLYMEGGGLPLKTHLQNNSSVFLAPHRFCRTFSKRTRT